MDYANPYESPNSDESDLIGDEDAELASRLLRLGAAFLDGLLAIIVVVPYLFLIGYMGRAFRNEIGITDLVLASVGGFVIYLLMHGYPLASRGQTIGKWLFRIRIVDFQTAQLLPLRRLVGLRIVPLWVISQIPLIGPLAALIDVLLIFGKERRCVHDLIAGTKVINA